MNKKILALCLVVVLAVTAVTGATLAYFTDTTNVVENTFSVGGIKITLDEAKVDANGKEITPEERVTKNEYKELIPGKILDKDPTIHMDSKNLDAYLAAKVTVSGADLAKIQENGVYNFYGIITGGETYTGTARELTDAEKAMFDAGVEAWAFDNVIITQTSTEAADGKDTVIINYYMSKVYKAGENCVLFEKVNIPASWTNTEMNAIEGLKIEVQAYAAQAGIAGEGGFTSCLEAMSATWGTALHVKGDTTGENVA